MRGNAGGTPWNAKEFLRTRMLERRAAQVHIWSIHPDIEIALFTVNPVTRKPFLGASPPPAETPGGACNPSAPPGELCQCNLEL